MILIPEITLPTGEVYEDAFGVVETIDTDANLALWESPAQKNPIRWTPLNIYQIVPGQEDQDTIDALAAIGIPASIL